MTGERQGRCGESDGHRGIGRDGPGSTCVRVLSELTGPVDATGHPVSSVKP